MTDAEKHEWCIERTGFPAVFLSPSLYEMGVKAGHDMRWYVKQKPIPKR